MSHRSEPAIAGSLSSGDQFRLLVEAVRDYAILGLDFDGLVTTWNSGAARSTGYRPEEIIGRHFSVFYLTEDAAAGLPAAQLAAAITDGSVEAEGWRVRKDGSQFWASVVITALFDDDHRPRGFAQVTRDVTERRATERALHESEDRARRVEAEARLAAIVKSSSDAIVSWSLDGTVASWNDGAERLLGYDAEEMVGRNIVRPDADGRRATVFMPPGLADDLPEIIRQVTHGEGDGNFETQRIRKDGTVIDISLSVSPIRDAAGALIGMSAVAHDITKPKVHERLLAAERRRLRAAESIGHVGSWETDAANKTMRYSDTLLELYGVDPATFTGDYPTEIRRIHRDDRAGMAAAVDACQRTGEPMRQRYRVYRANDRALRWFDVRGERIYEDGLFMRLVGAVADVTESVLAAKAAEDARDEAVEASRQKSAFLATMSHEIRTPMNAVIGMTGLLSDTALSAEQREFVETVRNSGDSLLAIINDILDFSKIEAGGLELEVQPFDLRSCVEDALDLIGVAAAAKGLELVGHVDQRCPAEVVGDVTRLRQVLVNLLSNAVKFTPQGEVVLTVEPLDPVESVESVESDAETVLRFAVADTGIGIPADRLASLFDSFSQVDASTTRVYGGTGLGLAISHRLVEAMGATLAVDSISGAGSTFHFALTLRRGALGTDEPDSPAPAALAGRSALVVDDNPTNRRILRLQLEGWKMHVTEADSAQAALAIVASGDRFDIAVIDMKMPHMSGADLAALLRADPDTSLMPLVLLSSHTERLSPQHRRLFSSVLTKPIRGARFHTSLCRALAPGEAPLVPPRPDATEHVLRVLLVEDNPVNQLVGRRLLDKLGYLVDVAGNGREAVEAVRLVDYDAVLMDVQMPEMDGLEASRVIRLELPADRQPHIVAMTASVLVEDRQACHDAGMDDYLPKPVRIEDLDNALCHINGAHSK